MIINNEKHFTNNRYDMFIYMLNIFDCHSHHQKSTLAFQSTKPERQENQKQQNYNHNAKLNSQVREQNIKVHNKIENNEN